MSEPVAIVTGANRGLGLEVSRELARRGLRVVLTARSLDKAETAAQTLRSEGLEVHPETVDVSSDDSVATFTQRVLAEFEHPGVLVNNAGAIFDGTNDRADEGQVGVLGVAPEVVLASVNTNTLGAYRMTQRLLPSMNEAGYGRVVNVSSGMGALHDMGTGWPGYRISKTALHAVTRLFHEAAHAGVKVNAVCPGWVRTDMGGDAATRSVPEGAAGIVLAATLDEHGPSGAFLRDGATIDW